MINDGYGNDQQQDPDQALSEVDAVLTKVALGVLRVSRPDWQDMLQEGRIEFWHAHREGNSTPLSVWRARRRMRAFAFRGQAETGYRGHTGRHGVRREPEQVAILDAPIDDDETAMTLGDLIAEATSIDGVEVAYHHGEIQAALDALTERQRRYVYARFWCGIDATDGLHMNEGVRAAREANPDVRDRSGVLWTGNKTTKGAKQRLVEHLGHLQEAR